MVTLPPQEEPHQGTGRAYLLCEAHLYTNHQGLLIILHVRFVVRVLIVC